MKVLKQGVCLALIGAGLAVAPSSLSSVASAAPSDPTIAQRMQDDARGSIQSSTEQATGRLSFVRAGTNGDLLADVDATDQQGAVAKVASYLSTYASAFGAAAGQLQRSGVQADDLGWTVDYTQSYQGVPVFGSLVRAHVDRAGDLTTVNGFAAPDISLDTEAARTPAQAAERAIAFVTSDPAEAQNGEVVETPALKAVENELVVYRTGAIKGEEGENVLAYVVEVGNGSTVRDKVFVDAESGKVLNRYSMIDNALDRELREAAGTPAAPTFTTVWNEGDAFPGNLNVDQQNLVNSSSESYWFFRNAFGRDSYDGNGAKRITVNNDPRISCPNANWNGTTTNYCNGVTSDDVVAHEWGHAYTEYTWGGIYQWQSGALNEAYSDIWGETTDLINAREDEGEGDLNAPRPVGLCSANSAANPLLTINAPSTIAKDCVTGGLLGPAVITPVTGDVVTPTDAVETGGTATNGCSTYTDPAAAVGKIVMVDRGLCTFVEKAQMARTMGAAAVVIGNSDAAPVSFSSPDETLPTTVSIGLADREAIRTAVTAGTPVNITINDASGERVDSYRWLIGEKSTAFGGAIRDMWNPTCYGDPGKVSDVEYTCSTDDNGGVHGNSGVPNHGYALLVDGGTYNGGTVEGIGLTKAASIYFRAMNNYMTPVSDFADHADALDASCRDLTGQALKELSTDANDSQTSRERITSADCEQVAAMAEVVELRDEPVQCDFQPQLDPNEPGVCGAGTETANVFSEDFEAGIGDWALDGEVVFPGGIEKDWVSTTSLPEGNKPDGSRTAAFGPAEDGDGVCSNAEGDYSSVNTMTSPDIEVGEEAGFNPRLSFDHNIGTELGFDGGTVLIAVNGGDFEVVPAAAYTFNEPSVIATAASGNTNPLAGQAGFTGTDGGEIVSDWGTSQIDLETAGVQPGDTIQVQFAIGRDGCGGVDGWWVDNVNVVLCEGTTNLSIAATRTPEPSTFGTPSTLAVTVDGPDTGAAPTGKVDASIDGTPVGSGTLTGGATSIPLPATLPAGSHRVVLAYGGSSTYSALNRSTRITIAPAASTVTATRSPASTPAGTASTLAVKVAPAGELAIVPKGGVIVTDATGTEIVRGAIDAAGAVSLTLPGTLPAGPNRLTVSYPGDAGFAPSTTTVDAVVTGATPPTTPPTVPPTAPGAVGASTTKANTPGSVAKGRKFKAKIKVGPRQSAPTGRVEIRSGGKVVGRGTLSDGTVEITVGTGRFGVGKTVKFTAVYPGSATMDASRDAFKVRILRRQ